MLVHRHAFVVPCVPRECADVEPSRGTMTNMHSSAGLRATATSVVPLFHVEQTLGCRRTTDHG